jgi:hypothetical protein
MPCNTVTVQAVGGLENALPDLVKAALSSWSGYPPRVQGQVLSCWSPSGECSVMWEKGLGLLVSGRNSRTVERHKGEILQAYSKAAVSWAASRAGWRVLPVKGSANKLVVQRGS